MKKRILFETYFLGFIFLLSGFIKSTDTTLFIQTISMYGIKYIEYAAPVIIIIEIYIGLAFLLQKNKYQITIFGLFFILFVSVIFIYGLIFKDITECGCFGKLKVFDNTPWLTIIRNIILTILCIDIIYYYKRNCIKGASLNIVQLTTICIVAIGAFSCGYSTRFTKKEQTPFQPQHVNESKLKEYITVSSDSTYLVFAFSYTCPHCINSIGNLSQYEPNGIVDKVIPLAIKNNEAKNRFDSFFGDEYDIIHISKDSMLNLTKELPVAYYIKNDSIKDILKGELPSGLLFKMLYP